MCNLPPTDSDGFLRNLEDWNPAVAERLASADGTVLTDAHWAVLNLARTYYERYETAPSMRPLVKTVRDQLGADTGRSIALMKLFGGEPAKTVAKWSGLPKPSGCS